MTPHRTSRPRRGGTAKPREAGAACPVTGTVRPPAAGAPTPGTPRPRPATGERAAVFAHGSPAAGCHSWPCAPTAAHGCPWRRRAAAPGGVCTVPPRTRRLNAALKPRTGVKTPGLWAGRRPRRRRRRHGHGSWGQLSPGARSVRSIPSPSHAPALFPAVPGSPEDEVPLIIQTLRARRSEVEGRLWGSRPSPGRF